MVLVNVGNHFNFEIITNIASLVVKILFNTLTDGFLKCCIESFLAFFIRL